MCLEKKKAGEEDGGITTENGGYLHSKIAVYLGEKHY